MAVVRGEKLVLLFSEKEPLSLDEISGQIVLLLNAHNGGMTGSQLARELEVSDSAVSRAAEKLVNAGIIRRERSEIARNVKVYSSLIRVVDEKTIKEIEKRVPPVIRQVINQAFKGQEILGMIFADQLMEYISVLPSDKQGSVLQEFLRRREKDEENKRAAEET